MQPEARVFTKSGLDAAIAAAQAEERRRIRAITSLPEAAGRESLALHLATATAMSADKVKTILASAPIATVGDRAGNSNAGLLWDKVLADRGAATNAEAAQGASESAGSWHDVMKRKGFSVGAGA